jgi:two-component system CheB/CheR fusion protein
MHMILIILSFLVIMEVLSSNEELQSINEELETSKEELQSTNEELTTINDELQLRNAELKDAGDYAKAIVETMHESLLILNENLQIQNANKGYYQTFQVIPDETESVYLFELHDGIWDIPELRRAFKMLQTKDIPLLNFEFNREFSSIGKRSLLINAHKFPTKEGSRSLILVAIQDLTERKQMEDTLIANEERYRMLIQNSSDIITVFDQDGTIKYESSAVETMLGYSTDERMGRNLTMDPVIHQDDRNRVIELFKTSVKRPGESINGQFRMLHKGGTYKTIDAIFRNVLKDPKMNGIIANYRDVTERNILEKQKAEFIKAASDELKNPVANIKSYTQKLNKVFDKSNDTGSAELIEKMNKQVDQLTSLIFRLMDFTQIDGTGVKSEKES